MRFFVKISSAVNDTSAEPVPFDTLNLSAVSPSSIPPGRAPPEKAMSRSFVLPGVPARPIWLVAVMR